MPKKFNNKYLNRLIFASYILSLFLLGVGFLIGSPKVVKIVESRITFLGNQNQEKTEPLITKVEGAQTETKPQIIDKKIPTPKFSALAVYLEDFNSGELLFQKDGDKQMPPASVTKIMTALVATEYFKAGDLLMVPETAMVGGSSMGVQVGERLSFRSLLYGMMLNSGNDAAYTIAENYPGGLVAFVGKMNEKVQSLGLKNTHFQNPAGFDAKNQYSSASDLARIAREAISNYQIAKVVSTKETSVVSWDKTHQHVLRNLNKLLSEDGVIGIKTGSSPNAGENLIGLVDRDEHKILTVVLNSQDRFSDTKALMDWVYQNFEWK